MTINKHNLLFFTVLFATSACGSSQESTSLRADSNLKKSLEAKYDYWVNAELCSDLPKGNPEFFRNVTATLVDFEPEYHRFLNDNGASVDGSAPYGLFSVVEPQEYFGRKIGVIFLYDCNGLASQFLIESIYGLFSFGVPYDFLDSEYENLHNDYTNAWNRLK